MGPALACPTPACFAPGVSRCEMFAELEEPLISALDKFNILLLAFDQGSYQQGAHASGLFNEK